MRVERRGELGVTPPWEWGGCSPSPPAQSLPCPRPAPPRVGLAAGLEQRQQDWVVLVAAVIQGLLVEVGEQLHALQTARGAQPHHTQQGEPCPARSPAALTVGKAALGSPPPEPFGCPLKVLIWALVSGPGSLRRAGSWRIPPGQVDGPRKVPLAAK